MNALNHIDVYYPGLNYVGRMWVDPLIHLVLDTFGQSSSLIFYFLSQCLILFIGSVCLCHELGATKRESLAGALCICIASYFCVGLDPYLLALHWFPALAAVLVRFRRIPSLKNLLLSLLVVALWLFSSGPLVLFGSLLALAMAGIPNVALTTKRTSVRETRERPPYFAVVGCILFVGSILAIPVYEMPQYADDARVTPISPLTFRGSPSIGPWLSPVTLVWHSYQETNLVYSLKFALVALLFCVVMSCYRRWSWRSAILILLFLIAVVAESLLKGKASLYTPFQTLWRLVPGVGLADLPWMLVPYGLVVGVSVGARRLGAKCLTTTLCLLVVLTGGVQSGFVEASGLLRTPELLTRSTGGLSYFEDRQSRNSESMFSQSPSAFVAEYYGDWVLKPNARLRSFENLNRLVQGKDFDAKASASINDSEAFLALDNDANTRWKTGRPQRAGDVFALEFTYPIRVVRVVLSVKSVPADFPRGIQVRASDDCTQWKTLIHQPHWHGPVMWTSEGAPYFGAQSWVILDFPEQQELRCLDFKLRDGHPVFDWSIDEVKLYQEKR